MQASCRRYPCRHRSTSSSDEKEGFLVKKKIVALIPTILGSTIVILLLSACGRMSATDAASLGSSSADAAATSISDTPTASPEPTSSTADVTEAAESSAAATSESSAEETSSASTEQSTVSTAETSAGADSTEASSGTGFTNDLLAREMNAVNSYGRISKTTGTSEGVDPFVTIYSYSTVRSPYADHYSLEFPPSSTYAEDMVIGDTMYTRMEKKGAWEKYGPGEWQREKPLTFSYDLQAAKYDIDYQKLVYVNAGNETVNGMECIHYQVSGTFDGEYEPNPGMEKYPVTMTVSGDIWIADINAAGPALIRQRLLLKSDVTGTDGSHMKEETSLEDDTLDINSTVIEAPIK
jgi:hypothetical protein